MAVNASSARAAAPESTASAALATPSPRLSTAPPTYTAAPALSSARSRSGPGSPSRMRRVVAALASGVPPPMASGSARASPTSSGATSYVRSSPPSTSTTRVVAEVLISSRPSALETTSARSAPSRASAPAIVSRNAGSETPMTWRVAPAGFVSGPRKLKMVRTASSLRTGITYRVAPWWAGANMKPKPASSMQRATASGRRSMRTPSASSRSAEPDSPVAERLPCLATEHPAPAAISAAVVETLKVGRPPPVPAVSTRSSMPAWTGVAKRRMVRASPTISSTVSPLVRSATSTPAVSTSEALPSMISASTAEVSSTDRSSRDMSRSIAPVMTGLGIGEEVLEQPLPVRREHGLRVELDPFRGQLAVAHRHQDAAAVGGRLQAVGEVRIDDERVVAADHERRREPGEQAGAVVIDVRGLAVHGHVADHRAAEGLRERLVAQADAERRDARLGKPAHHLDADARLVRRAGARRDHRAVPGALEQLLDGDGVVADHVQLRAQLAEVLDEVVGERVVVVDDEDARHAQSACRAANSIARTTP